MVGVGWGGDGGAQEDKTQSKQGRAKYSIALSVASLPTTLSSLLNPKPNNFG